MVVELARCLSRVLNEPLTLVGFVTKSLPITQQGVQGLFEDELPKNIKERPQFHKEPASLFTVSDCF